MKLSFFLPGLIALVGTDSPCVTGTPHLPELATRKLHKQTKDLYNGAELSVNIVDLPSNATLSQGINAMNVTLNGTASVGQGRPDVSYIYVVDTSGSTDALDGGCGTELQCIHGFLKNFNNETIADGSAKLAAVINFDDNATVIAGWQNPRNPDIADAFNRGFSDGGTNCSAALLEAKKLFGDPLNTAGKTVIVFAGDGLCTDDETARKAAVDAFSTTGAIIHTVAVGDEINCDEAQLTSNNLDDFPKKRRKMSFNSRSGYPATEVSRRSHWDNNREPRGPGGWRSL